MKRQEMEKFCSEVKKGNISSDIFGQKLSKMSPQSLLENIDLLIGVNEVSSGMFVNYTNMNATKMSEKELEYVVNLLGNKVIPYYNKSAEEKVYNEIKKVHDNIVFELNERKDSIKGLMEHFNQELIERTDINSNAIKIFNSLKTHPMNLKSTEDRVIKLSESYMDHFKDPGMMISKILPCANDIILAKESTNPKELISIYTKIESLLENNDCHKNIVIYKNLLENERRRFVKNDRLDTLIEKCENIIYETNNYCSLLENVNSNSDFFETINTDLLMESMYKISYIETRSVEEDVKIVKEFANVLTNLSIINESEIEDDIEEDKKNSDKDKKEKDDNSKKKNIAKKMADAALYPIKQLAKLPEAERRNKILKNNLPAKIMRTLRKLIRMGLGFMIAGPAGMMVAFLAGVIADKKIDEKVRRRLCRELETEYKIISAQIKDIEGDSSRTKEKYELMRLQDKIKLAYSKARFNVD